LHQIVSRRLFMDQVFSNNLIRQENI